MRARHDAGARGPSRICDGPPTRSDPARATSESARAPIARTFACRFAGSPPVPERKGPAIRMSSGVASLSR